MVDRMNAEDSGANGAAAGAAHTNGSSTQHQSSSPQQSTIRTSQMGVLFAKLGFHDLGPELVSDCLVHVLDRRDEGVVQIAGGHFLSCWA